MSSRLLVKLLLFWSLASQVHACTISKSPDLHGLMAADFVVSGTLVAFEEAKHPFASNPDRLWPRMTFATRHTFRGKAPQHFHVFLHSPGMFEDLEALFPTRRTYVMALSALSASAPDAKIPTLQVAGSNGNCGGSLFFKGDSPQSRAIRLIFEDFGDRNAKIELFNAFFYGQTGRY